MDGNASFGHWLQRRRNALRLTQRELAQQVGCAAVTIRKIEADERRPSVQIAQRLAARLALAPAERAAFLHAARAELCADQLSSPVQFPSLPALHRRLSNLPAPLTPLIGRDQELAVVRNSLTDPAVRLLTLHGPPGIGKTRLGLHSAVDMGDAFDDGCCFIALAPIHDPSLVAAAIVQALGLRASGSQSLIEQLTAYLRTRCMLLVLDNFEQLLAAAPLVGELLAAAPRLKALITSRTTLRLAGEHVYVVPPLALPALHPLPPIEALARYAAVDLFVQRARAVVSNFALTGANAAAVAAICRRLDGLPLAIELAAARSRLFAPAALLARLDHCLPVLTGGGRDVPPHQQTLRGTIDWSYNLHTEAEQALLRRLAVFVGGCTLEAAAAVCADTSSVPEPVRASAAGPPVASHDTLLNGLEALVNQSLVYCIPGADAEPRFTMLETIHEYALERLEESGEAERLRRQHAGYYLTLGVVDFPDVWDPAQTAHLVPEYDNLWSALAWSQTSAGDPELALRLTRALRILWFRRGIRREAIAALERALTQPHGVGRTVAHAAARFELGQFLAFTGDYAAARPQFEQTLQLAHEVGDRWWYAVALENLGWMAREQGDSATAWARLSESLAIFRELGHASSIAESLYELAEVAIVDEDAARAEALLAESRVLEQRENHVPTTIGWTLNHLGHAAQLRGAFDDAAQLHHESLASFQAYGDQHFGIHWAYHDLGETALGQGRLDEAARWLAQGLSLSETLGDQASMSWCLAGLGSAAALDGQPERAAQLWGAAEQLRQAIGCRSAPAARTTYERALGLAHAQLGEEAFAAAWAAGRALTLEQAIAYALDTRA